MFFNRKLASDESTGMEILVGTPLRMPKSPDYNSFRKMITQVLMSLFVVFSTLCTDIQRSILTIEYPMFSFLILMLHSFSAYLITLKEVFNEQIPLL